MPRGDLSSHLTPLFHKCHGFSYLGKKRILFLRCFVPFFCSYAVCSCLVPSSPTIAATAKIQEDALQDLTMSLGKCLQFPKKCEQPPAVHTWLLHSR